MSQFTTKSGAEVVIALAPWKDAKALKKALEKELLGRNLGSAISFTDSLELDSNAAAALVEMVLKVDGSDLVDAALWPCLIRCTYNAEKITENTFDTPGGRKDYYEIVMACIKENIGPLVESLLSQFAAYVPTKKAAQNDSPSLQSATK